jgi:adenylate cyclase
LTPAQYETPATTAYLSAFAKLEAGDPGAMGAFASRLGNQPQDHLASFHLKRLPNGAKGVRIVMD